MKKIILILTFLCISTFIFSESKIDDLMKDDAQIHSNIAVKTNVEKVAKDAYVEKISGQAFLKSDNSKSWVQIVEKSVITEKMTVITMENSKLRIKTKDGGFINLGQRTKVYFETMKGEPQKEEISETGIKLFWGKIYSNVKKKVENGGKYEIKTGSVVAGVRGTKFLVTSTRTGESSIIVYQGTVAASNLNGDLETLVEKGEKLNVGSDGVIGNKEIHSDNPPEEEISDADMVEDNGLENKNENEENTKTEILNEIKETTSAAKETTSLKMIIR